jgi:lysozyme
MVFLFKANAMEGHVVNNMAVSPAGVKLIERFEGYRDKTYTCAGGKPTIGFGHVLKENENFANGLSRKDAEKLLEKDIEVHVFKLTRMVTVPLTQWQFDALASFIYNLGEKNLGDSTLLKYLNDKKYEQVAPQFLRWCFAKKQYLPGLFKRRLAEMFVFQDGTTIPDDLSVLKLGKTEQTLLMTYQNLDASLKREAVQIYLAYKANWPDGL